MLRIMVTYDIPNDKARKKISDTCLDYGLDRQQYSVFTGLLRPVQVRALAKAIKPLVKDGHVMIVLIASNQWEQRVEIGESMLNEYD